MLATERGVDPFELENTLSPEYVPVIVSLPAWAREEEH
jgi:hypothetical protein